MKPFSAQIKKPAPNTGVSAMPTKVIKTSASQTVVGGVSRSVAATGSRRLRGV
jgi:hypothetical protein